MCKKLRISGWKGGYPMRRAVCLQVYKV